MHIVSILNYKGFVFTVSLVDSSVNWVMSPWHAFRDYCD